jgi:hypothetical protein
MGKYYTALLQIGVSNLGQTLTHGLSITPGSLIARIIPRNFTNTATAPVGINTIGTNIITVSSGVGLTQTCDVEVQLIHSVSR